MRHKPLTSLLSTLGVALLVSSCAGGSSAAEGEPTPSPSETSETPAGASDDSEVEATEEVTSWYEPEGGMVYTRVGEEVETTPVEEIDDFDPADYEELRGEIVSHLECADEEALEAKAEHNADREQPVGWPQKWDGDGSMPDPLCHPDYLEIGEWVHFEEFNAAWEGDETSNIWRTYHTDDEINVLLWEQSQARAEWTP